MKKKKLIIFSSLALVLVLLLVSFYYLAVFRAESSLQKLVKNQSEGKINFKVRKVNLDIFNLRFDFQNPELRTIDSSNTVSGYHIKADRIFISVHSLASLFIGKQLIIDSVIIQAPHFDVIKYQQSVRRKISVTEEMNQVYLTLEKVLKILNLNYLHIGNARFRVFDRSKMDTRPLQISNINLTIDQFSNENSGGKNKFLHADRILLEIYNEDFIFPDGNHGIRFKKFWMGTRTRKIQLDSCYIYSQSKDISAGEFSIFIDSLRVYKLDFNALAERNAIKFDSAVCVNPDINFRLENKGDAKKHSFGSKTIVDKDSVDQKLKKILGNLDIGYIAVKNANVKIITAKNNKVNVFQSQSSNFSIAGLVVHSDDALPIEIGSIKLDLHNYTSYSPDSMYVIQFDDVVMQDEKIRLNNFRIVPTLWNRDKLKKEIKMQAFELDDIDWLAMLYENRLIAGHASLISPDVHLVLPKSGQKPEQEKQNPFKMLEKIQDKIHIGELFVENGRMKFEILHGPSFSINNCHIGINVNQLLAAGNKFRIINAFDTMSFAKGEFHNAGSHFTIEGGSFSKSNSTLFFKKIAESNSSRDQSVSIADLKFSGIAMDTTGSVSLSEISWRNANINYVAGNNEEDKTPKSGSGGGYKISIAKLSGGSANFRIKVKNIEASTTLTRISTGSIVLENGQKPRIKNLFIDGQLISLDQGQEIQGSFDNFRIADNQPSYLSNILLKLPFKGETANVFVPKLYFKADIQNCLAGNINADYFELSNPKISFSKHENVPKDTINKEKKEVKFPKININRITLDQPEFLNLPSSQSEKIQFNPGKTRLDLLGIQTEENVVRIDSLKLTAYDIAFKSGKLQLSPKVNAKLNLKASELLYKPKGIPGKNNWSFYVNSFDVKNYCLNALQGDSVKQSIVVNSLEVDNMAVNDSLSAHPHNWLNANTNFSVVNGNINLVNAKTRLEIYNLSLLKSANNLSFDSIVFSPVADRDSFMKTKDFQTTYIQLRTGKINVKDIDFERLLKDTVIASKKVILNDLRLSAYKDKRLPFRHGVEKPMLTNLLLNINPKIQFDSVLVRNGLIEYEEFNNKTQQYGKIRLSKVKGALAGIRTFDPSPDDSLRFNLYARLMDTADIRVKYKQSYADSLSGFNIKLIVNSLNLTALNPMLRPFASAELKSGNLDTIRMSAIGRKYIAYGVMKMYYSDLNAQYLSKGDSSTKNVVTKSVSFFANRIVHTKNRRGTGDVFAERDPEKGFVNYWVKIVVGGVLTNTGVRTDKKQLRKYRKALDNHAVPPIPDIPVDY